MRLRSSVSPLCLVLLTGCPTTPTTTPPPSDDGAIEEPSTPIIPAEPANHTEGDELEATIPVIGGDSIELSSLRGRPVLLEISASWEPGFAEAHALYAELLAEHGELAVIVVVADPEDAGLSGLPPEFTLAWDPAGALAAKFSVATFPTMFVIDRGGRISAVVNGWDAGVHDALRESVARASSS
ncbi:AhpC/TSA family protein [Enhygromyxa salina]|uniref:AhpC/TSA family protein n=1 Tax=Enhygromyxa salina TaxID=215803 RepID=A0A2S9XCD8_9BACT|nr:TlpA disulfide reductase family protein [Enhygromyxa salina]PRP90518.1 AhpC/TSA family protein [Enhygromyxa salina]